jgi:hypothetical protein
VDVLTAFRHRPDVQVFGLMNLAKLEFPEDSDSGAAHPGGLAALGYALNVLPAYEDNEAVQVLFIRRTFKTRASTAARRTVFRRTWPANIAG